MVVTRAVGLDFWIASASARVCGFIPSTRVSSFRLGPTLVMFVSPAAVAEGARAFWRRVLPEGVAAEVVSKQFRHSGGLNYWSAAAAPPLGLDNAAHLDALKRAYERFPEIGGRSTP